VKRVVVSESFGKFVPTEALEGTVGRTGAMKRQRKGAQDEGRMTTTKKETNKEQVRPQARHVLPSITFKWEERGREKK